MAVSSAASSSGLDVNSIVSQLMTVEQRPLTALAKKEAGYQAKLSALGSIKGALSGFQSAVSGLSDIAKFKALTATPSDNTILTASASSIAVAGTYSLDITTLAQSQKLVAAGQASTTAAIGGGTATTLTLDFGTIAGGTFNATTGKYTGSTFTSNGNGTKTVTIDATNNSLQGIRDAINAANIGVTATIVNDGSATPYRLSLVSDTLGSTNSLKISVAGDATISGLLAQDPATTQNLSETVAAQNASFKVNGVTVSKTSNTVTDVIQGVTLNLQKVTTTSASLTVARDTATINTSVTGFVKAYNDLNNMLSGLSGYNAATKQGAILQGDSTVRTLQSQIRAVLNTSISNTGGSLTTLSQVGVSFQKDGTLALDATKLNTAITNNFSDIASLFAAVGKPSDSLVNYSSATTATKPGSYAVNVTTLATQGNLVGNAVAGLTITGGTNDALSVTVNGVSASVVLAAGTYATAAALAAEVQSKINGANALSSAGIAVAVTQSAGTFTITSNSYGSASSVAVAGTGASNLLGGAPVANSGVNVAGTINALTATGLGQYLTSTTGDATGLGIQISGGVTGARGTVNYSQGYAYTLNALSTTFLANGGPLDGKTTGINSSLKDIAKQRDALNLRLANIEKRYRTQFTALDQMLSSMSTTSTYLTQQLAKL